MFNYYSLLKFQFDSFTLPTYFLYYFQSAALRRVIPLLDRILVQRIEAVSQTKGGIVIPESSQSKVNQGTVIAVGPGGRDKVRNKRVFDWK